MSDESLDISGKRREDLNLHMSGVRETLILTNKDNKKDEIEKIQEDCLKPTEDDKCTSPTKITLEGSETHGQNKDKNHLPSARQTHETEDGSHTSPKKITIKSNKYGQSQYKTHSPNTGDTEGLNDQRKKTNDSNKPSWGKQDQNIGRHSDKLYDDTCESSTVITIEKGQDSNKSTEKKEGNEKKIWKTNNPLRSKQDRNPRSNTDKAYAMYDFFITEKVKIMLKRVFGVIGVALIVLAWFCLLSGQATKTGDANELNSPHHREREKRDTSTVNWKIVNPVLKIGAPLCISFQGQAPRCTVHFDNKTISSDADQYGSIRVHANGKKCILCIHNFHLANHTINRPIQVDSGLYRIATTSLQDILKEGLVVYGTVIHEDNTVELIFSQIGQQAHCFYEDNSKINVTAVRIQLIYDHNLTVNLTHKRIVFDRCISFYVDCTVRKMHYFLDIPQCPLERNLPVILGVSIAVLLLLVVIIIAVICWRRRKNKGTTQNTAYQLTMSA